MAQPMTGEAPRARWSRRSIPLAVVGPVVLLLAVAGWGWSSAEQRDQVAVSLSSPPRCTATEVAWRRVGVGHRVPAMRVQEAMDCRSMLRVSNHGRWPVRITDVVMPLMGPHAGAAFDVEEVDGVRPVAGMTGGVASAVFGVDQRLAPGERYVVPINFTSRRGGCMARGTLIWFEQMPRIRVSALGWTGNVSGHQVIAFQGTAASDSCGSPPSRSIGPSMQTSP